MKQMKIVNVSILAALLLLNGCSGQTNDKPETGETGTNTAIVSTEPVTLKLMVYYGGFTDVEFDAYIVQHVMKKFPHITVEKVTGKLQDLITAGETPDIIMSGLPGIPALQEFKITEDLNPYIKKFGTDLANFDPVLTEQIKNFSEKGDFIALPFRMNVPALFYNKDIFDKFGIPYPKDGMTWEETASLARQLTRSDGDTQYLGLSTGGADRMGMGLSLPYVDKKTNEANLVTDGWQRVLNQFIAIHSVPGYVKDGKFADVNGMFLKEKVVGMAAFWNAGMIGNIEQMQKDGDTFNWDLVTLATFDKGHGFAWQAEAHNLLISSSSKHKDQAYQVVSYMAGDEALQKLFHKNGNMTSLKKTEQAKKEYGSEIAFLQGKNLNAFFTFQPGVHTHTKFDQKGRGLINDASKEVLLKGIDVNTALRTAQEKLNQYIRDQTVK
jgi:multiple sugar transport system substrate-binding protein